MGFTCIVFRGNNDKINELNANSNDPIRYRYSLIKPEKNIMIFQNITVYKGNLFF